jgi:hypothetical protein
VISDPADATALPCAWTSRVVSRRSAPCPIEPGLVRARIDHEEQVALLDRLVVHDLERDEWARDVRRDADHVGAHGGVVGARVDIREDAIPRTRSPPRRG